jgi:Uncharacterised nucleotidyltransferase
MPAHTAIEVATATRVYNHRSFPDAGEALLLRAACLPKAAANDAWVEWRSANDLAATSRTALELFPAIYRNLGNALGPDEGILGGVYRQTWVQNQLLFARAKQVVRLLEGKGIPTVLLKGAALTAGVYSDAGVRPMVDVDILVPYEAARTAASLLIEDGWEPEIAPGGSMAQIVQVVRSLDLVGKDNGRVDLHWHVLADECDPGDDQDFWTHAVACTWMTVPTRTLAPADQLLHTVYHGHKWSPSRSVLWLMDAYRTIEAAGPQIDWQRLVASADRSAAVLALLLALRYLREELGASVPGEAIERLSRLRTGLLDRLNYRSQDTDDNLRGVFRRELFGYLKKSQGRPLRIRVMGVSWYLQAAWGVSHPLQLLPKLVSRVYRRVRNAFTARAAPAPVPGAKRS